MAYLYCYGINFDFVFYTGFGQPGPPGEKGEPGSFVPTSGIVKFTVHTENNGMKLI